jgi:hypothetical protein
MLFYIVIFIFVIAIALIADFSEKPQIGLFAIGVVLTVTLGLRDYGVGTDTLIYPEEYFRQAEVFSWLDIVDYFEEYDVGYLLLGVISFIIWDDPQSMLFFTEAFIIGVTLIGVYRLKQIFDYPYVVYFLLYCLLFLNPSLNYMRQNCSVSILLIGFSYMLENKWGKYFIFQAIAFLFHSSSVLFLIVPFFYFLSLRVSDIVRYVLTIAFFLGVIIAVISFYDYLQVLSELGAVSETYGERYGETGKYSSENLYGVSYIAYVILNYLLIFYSYKNEVFSRENQYLILCLYTASVIFFYTSTFVVFLSRLAIYFDYVVAIYLAIMLFSKQIPIYIRAALVTVQLYMWVRLYVIAGSSETIPYTSEILGIS